MWEMCGGSFPHDCWPHPEFLDMVLEFSVSAHKPTSHTGLHRSDVGSAGPAFELSPNFKSLTTQEAKLCQQYWQKKNLLQESESDTCITSGQMLKNKTFAETAVVV